MGQATQDGKRKRTINRTMCRLGEGVFQQAAMQKAKKRGRICLIGRHAPHQPGVQIIQMYRQKNSPNR